MTLDIDNLRALKRQFMELFSDWVQTTDLVIGDRGPYLKATLKPEHRAEWRKIPASLSGLAIYVDHGD